MAQTSPPATIQWIDSQPTLNALCQQLHAEPFVTVDTEFHRERTFFAELALVQVGHAAGVALIDPLSGLDLAPLLDLLLDEQVLKVMHASRQDLEIFFDLTQAVVRPLFDTQIAAALLGLGDQLGYGALVSQVCGVHLAKAHGRADWKRRPIDAALRQYAADDVSHLRAVYSKLNADLRAKGRRGWLDEEQAVLTDPATYAPAPSRAWERIRGAGRLKGAQTAAAQALAAWREEQARARNLPRKRVLSDDLLLDLVKQRPRRLSDLDRLRGLGDDVKRRHGKTLLALLEQAFSSKPESWPAPRDKGRRAPADTALVDALYAVVTSCARQHGIAARLLAARSDLEEVVRGETDVPLLHGWRAQLAGEQVLAFLRGEAVLRAERGQLIVEARPS